MSGSVPVTDRQLSAGFGPRVATRLTRKEHKNSEADNAKVCKNTV